MNLENLLNLLNNVKKSGKQWTAQCPAHTDKQNSLSIASGNGGRILLKCFAGCEIQDITAALNLKMKDLFATPSTNKAITYPKAHTTVQPDCTLENYARDKQLDIDLLKNYGVRNQLYSGAPSIRIPYYALDRTEFAIRYRTALKKSEKSDNRFKWKGGSKPSLYGLWRINDSKYILLVEGESDTHTAWQHDLPALGLPGATNWKEEWKEYFNNIPAIYIILEPDKGGEAVLKWLAKSEIRHKSKLVFLPNAKDISDLHCQNKSTFKEKLQSALKNSVSWLDYTTKKERQKRDLAWEKSQLLAKQKNILKSFVKKLEQSGVVGVEKQAMLVYLCITSRVLSRPVSAVIKATSSAGKSFLVDNVLKFFPDSSYYVLTAMSERLLAYDDEPVKRRMLVIVEAVGMQGEVASLLMRSLLSEGQIRYKTVEKINGNLKPRLIEREGPTGLLVTTTGLQLHPENETRLFSIPINDSSEQTTKIMLAMANEKKLKIDYEEWHALQEWIQYGDHEVTIPYALILAEMIPPVAVRLRRDFKAVLHLITANTLLHQANRIRNNENKFIATFEDYGMVRELVIDIISEGLETAVSKIMRETVHTVENMKQVYIGVPVTFALIARELGIDKSTAKRRADGAIAAGYLINHSLENRPANLSIGDPLPEDKYILPTQEELERSCMVAVKNKSIHTD